MDHDKTDVEDTVELMEKIGARTQCPPCELFKEFLQQPVAIKEELRIKEKIKREKEKAERLYEELDELLK